MTTWPDVVETGMWLGFSAFVLWSIGWFAQWMAKP